jgi:DNA-binding protein
MTKAKMRLLLEMSVDLLQRVHGNICRSNINRDEKIQIAEDITEIIRKLFLLDRKLKDVKINGR